jgi:hypothetical protein
MRFARLRFAAVGAVVLIALVYIATVSAGTMYYWHGGDTVLGGAGTWDTTTTSTAWSAGTGSGYSGTYWPDSTNYDAYFGGAAAGGGAVTVSGTVTAGGLTVGMQTYTFSTGGTLALGGDGISVNVGSAHGTCTINSAVNLLTDQTWTVNTVAATTVRRNQQSFRAPITLRSHLFPPSANGFDRELRRIVVDADTHPTLILCNVVDAIRDGLPQILVHEVVDEHFFGFALELPFPPIILEFPDDFLLFRIHRDV